MHKTLTLAVAFAFALSTGAMAKEQCHDPKTGKFIKCPPSAAVLANNHCRDAKTKKFAKCGAPGTEPVPGK